jgi:hypothetical protein
MNAAAKILGSVVAWGICSTCWGQAMFYDHRSTAEGDIRSGMADQQAAWGAAARNWGEGYGLYMSGEEQRLSIAYQVYEIRRMVADDRRLDLERRANDRRRKQADEAEAFDAAARQLISEYRVGVVQWPEALNRSEFAESMSVIESMLAIVGQQRGAMDTYTRRALATEAGVLRQRVASNKAISHDSRVAAVKALKLAQRAAAIDVAGEPVFEETLAWSR